MATYGARKVIKLKDYSIAAARAFLTEVAESCEENGWPPLPDRPEFDAAIGRDGPDGFRPGGADDVEMWVKWHG